MQRPVSVTMFGILNFVFAALGVIGLIASFAVFSVPADSSDSVINLMHQGSGYAGWLKACIPLGLLSCGTWLASGFGLLRLKPWARPLSIFCAIYGIVFCIATLLVNLALMVQPFDHQILPQQELAVAVAIGGPISGTLGELFWPVYPILLLVFMLSPKMAATFRPPAPLPAQTAAAN
jgi:hypothetical protein